MREEAGEGIKHQMVTPSPDFLLFGLGRHAWYVRLPPRMCLFDSCFYWNVVAAQDDSSQ
jgi:hypothetical protein